jgi:type IV secretion system protein VirB6
MDIVTQLFSKIDTVAASAIQAIYQSLASGLLPVFTVALTIYVAYWGYEMIYGGAPLSAGSFVWRVVRIAIIYSLAFGWSDFSTLIVSTFTQGADGVASAVCTAVGGANCSSPENSISSTLSTLFTNAMNAGKTIAASGGWGAAIGLSLLSIVVLVVTVIFVTVAIALVVIGKVALFILLGLGPLFIALALFDFTSTLFSGWLRTCAQYAIVPVIVYAILGFLLTLMNQTITNLGTITDVSSGMTVIAPFLILCGVGTVLLPMALPIAASIAGGHALHAPWATAPVGWGAAAGGAAQRSARAMGSAAGFAALAGGVWAYQRFRPQNLVGEGSATMQPGSFDARAEQVSAALMASRGAPRGDASQQI